MTKRTYAVLAVEIREASAQVDLTDEEVKYLKTLTSYDAQGYLFDKINEQNGDWEAGDRLEIDCIELSSEIISD